MRLPVEVLSHIFFFCVRGNAESNLHMDQPPWLFGQVCRFWREVALATPTLWAWIPSITADSPAHTSEKMLHLLKTTLRLSATTPLALDFYDRGAPLSEVIYPHLTRCRQLNLTTDMYSLIHIAQLVTGQFRHLESLVLVVDCSQSVDVWKVSTFEDAPILRDVTLMIRYPATEVEHFTEPTNPDPHISWITLPWGQLTCFKGTFASTEYILDALHSAPLLAECVFISTYISLGSPVRPTKHDNLKSLVLFDELPSHLSPHSSLLDNLQLPSLRTLWVENKQSWLANAVSLIERSGCTLTTLVAHSASSERGEDLLALLKLCPELWTLDLRGTIAQQFLELGTKSQLVPNLRELHLGPNLSKSILLNSITELIDTTTPLKMVKIHFDQEIYCTQAYFVLRGWKSNPKTDPQYLRLLRRQGQLYETIEHKTLERRHVAHLDNTLNALEKEDRLGIHPRYIHRSKIVDAMIRVRNLSTTRYAPPDKRNIRERANVLVERWSASLKEWLASPLWLSHSPNVIIYQTNPQPSDQRQ